MFNLTHYIHISVLCDYYAELWTEAKDYLYLKSGDFCAQLRAAYIYGIWDIIGYRCEPLQIFRLKGFRKDRAGEILRWADRFQIYLPGGRLIIWILSHPESD